MSLAVKTYGRLDVAFNNAGAAETPAKVAELSENEWNRVIDVNLKGAWLCVKYQLPELLSAGALLL